MSPQRRSAGGGRFVSVSEYPYSLASIGPWIDAGAPPGRSRNDLGGRSGGGPRVRPRPARLHARHAHYLRHAQRQEGRPRRWRRSDPLRAGASIVSRPALRRASAEDRSAPHAESAYVSTLRPVATAKGYRRLAIRRCVKNERAAVRIGAPLGSRTAERRGTRLRAWFLFSKQCTGAGRLFAFERLPALDLKGGLGGGVGPGWSVGVQADFSPFLYFVRGVVCPEGFKADTTGLCNALSGDGDNKGTIGIGVGVPVGSKKKTLI
eukprot:460663-Prorocentrum_minimum.AAC.4